MQDKMPIPLMPFNPINSPAPASSSGKKHGELKQACSEMESLFINYLLKEMRATIPKSGFISGGYAEEMYTSMMDAELSKDIASRGGIGLAATLIEQIETRSADTSPQKTEKKE